MKRSVIKLSDKALKYTSFIFLPGNSCGSADCIPSLSTPSYKIDPTQLKRCRDTMEHRVKDSKTVPKLQGRKHGFWAPKLACDSGRWARNLVCKHFVRRSLPSHGSIFMRKKHASRILLDECAECHNVNVNIFFKTSLPFVVRGAWCDSVIEARRAGCDVQCEGLSFCQAQSPQLQAFRLSRSVRSTRVNQGHSGVWSTGRVLKNLCFDIF